MKVNSFKFKLYCRCFVLYHIYLNPLLRLAFILIIQWCLPKTTYFSFFWHKSPQWVMASFLRFLDHTQQCTTFSRTPLDEWSARHIDLYLTTHNTHNRQTSMPPVGFETVISGGERPQTYALDLRLLGPAKTTYTNRKPREIFLLQRKET
jgi:hypothetical protein